ncbi:MAG: extracellular solute-binding protein [Planctomycetes bacterium]|nr:extracellular solute-binding protein [Planctomycetota bacterium]
MNHRFESIIVLIILSCLVLAVGCRKKAPQRAGEQGQAEAQPVSVQEDVLRILTGEGHTPKQFVEDFEKYIETKYGRKVKVQLVYLSGPDDWYKLIRSKRVDLVLLTHHHFRDERYKYIENGLLLPLDLKNIPNFKNVIPTLQNAEYLCSDGKVYASPVSHGPYGLAYNTGILKEEPSSWNILWEPRFKGKYVIGANEYIYNCNITALALGYPKESVSSYDALNNKEFKDKLRQLAAGAHSFWIGADRVDDLAGKPLATAWGDSMSGLKERGELWKMAEPKEGTSCWIDNYTITWTLADKPFLKKVAEECINRFLSTEYQINHITRLMSLTPIITNTGDLLTVEERERLHIGTPNFFRENRILQNTYSERDRNGLKLLWDEAMEGINVE